MVVVSDTTAICALYLIKRLDLLHLVFDSVIIPQAVFNELKLLENFGYNISELRNSKWIQVKHPSDLILIEQLKLKLDEGESEAIA